MNITSEIKISSIPVEIPNKPLEYYKDKHTLIYEKNFTEHLLCVPTKHSDNFYIYKHDNIIGASLYYYGEYTELECNLLRRFINNESVIYDIGANIGVHSVALANMAKHLYAFEPNLNNYRLLKLNTQYHKNITIFDTAISNKVGTTKIETFELGTLGNYGECKLSEHGTDCSMTTIDTLVNNKVLLEPSIIKIDVEGHEFEVFQGMENTIKNSLPVIFYEAMHCDLGSIYDMLTGLGYKLYWYPVPNYNPDNFNKNLQNIFGNGGVVNIIAIPFHINIQTNLPTVIDRNDTWSIAYMRIQNAKSH